MSPTAIDQEKMDKSQNSPVSFDQTKPPLKPVAHQEYPKMMYLWPKDKTIHPLHGTTVERGPDGKPEVVTDFTKTPGGRIKIAGNTDEEKALIAKGFRDKPHKQEVEEELPADFEADIPEPAAPAAEAKTESKKT